MGLCDAKAAMARLVAPRAWFQPTSAKNATSSSPPKTPSESCLVVAGVPCDSAPWPVFRSTVSASSMTARTCSDTTAALVASVCDCTSVVR